MPGTSGDIGAALEGVALDELLEVERAQWGNDPETYGERYLPTARLIFPEVGRIDIRTAVEAIRRENADGRAWAEVSFEEVEGRWLSPGAVALLTYLARARSNYETVARGYLCSTVYLRLHDEWRAAFHQRTLAD
ncbi:MAG TPA: nuclear transport factor 2 family protein [Acidimicrobiia bacterium]|jgi:hypothetical protein